MDNNSLSFNVSLEDKSNAIISELALAQPGTDEGLIPVYSILNEVLDIPKTPPIVLKSVEAIKKILDDLLDKAQPWNEAALKQCQDWSTWMQDSLVAIQENKEIEPFVLTIVENSDGSNTSTESSKTTEEPDEALLTFNLDDDRELLEEFVVEAREHLEIIEATILTLENDPQDAEGMSSVFRAFHTIKGVSGFLQLDPVQRLAHEVESLLDLARNHKLILDSNCITQILLSRDVLGKFTDQIQTALANGTMPNEIIEINKLIFQVKVATDLAPKTVEDFSKKESTEDVEVPEAIKNRMVSDTGLKTDTVPDSVSDETPEKKEAVANTNSTVSATIRVDSEKVANLMDMVGELVIVESQINETISNLKAEDLKLQRNMAQLSRITKDLQHNSMALRMVPIKPTFQKVGRMVRDLSRNFHKEIQFKMSGEDTELDRNVVEQIGDPLIHMIRNSIDHGLESDPKEREKLGKSRTGNVVIKAYHMGSNIVIELSDDGKGLPTEKILAKAKKLNLIDANRDLSSDEVNQLIFLPGFSTAEKVTEVSGRGVGMDVVKRNIEALRGSVAVHSVEGEGTTFKIKLPLTTAIIEGLVVLVGDERFIIPTNAVNVIIRPTKSQLSTITGKSEMIVLRDETIPLIRLHTQFGIEPRVIDPAEGSVVIIESFGKRFGVLVDDMVTKQEVVIKNLGYIMRQVNGVAGGAILGDGNIALILDTAGLLANFKNYNN